MRLIEKARVAFRDWINQPSADELDAEAERRCVMRVLSAAELDAAVRGPASSGAADAPK